MKRLFKVFTRFLIALPFLAAAVFAFIYWRISNPSSEALAMPPELVALTSEEGQFLLASADARADLEALQARFVTQEKATWCGVASSVIVLNALNKASTQSEFFDDRTNAVRSFWKVTFGGMPLDDLGRLLQAHDVVVDVRHAADSSLEDFRARAIANLKNPWDFLIVNYLRAGVGQAGPAGHISPVGAYDSASDRFLVLDVASYKYPPAWIPAKKLWDAMNTVDEDGGKTRGYVLVSANALRPQSR